MNMAHDSSNAESPGAQRWPDAPRHGKEEWHERAKWMPTAKEFEAYLVREVEMAKVNISRGNPANSTLHSATTIALAQEELDRETGNKS